MQFASEVPEECDPDERLSDRHMPKLYAYYQKMRARKSKARDSLLVPRRRDDNLSLALIKQVQKDLPFDDKPK